MSASLPDGESTTSCRYGPFVVTLQGKEGALKAEDLALPTLIAQCIGEGACLLKQVGDAPELCEPVQ